MSKDKSVEWFTRCINVQELDDFAAYIVNGRNRKFDLGQGVFVVDIA
jgi:hypothetical protein